MNPQLLSPSAAGTCLHCGQPNGQGRSDGYCCAGCHVVSRLLHEAGLERYYELKPGKLAPMLGYFDPQPTLDWVASAPGMAEGRLELGIEGIQCGACVWAIEQLAARAKARAGVNTALGRLSLRFVPGNFDALGYLKTLGSLGYRIGRPGEESRDPSRGLLLRLGVCAAIAMNSMSFTLPFYFGLAEDGTGLDAWLRQINLALTSVSVAYGGGYFFKRSFQALRLRLAHFDIPVALGIASVFAGSLWAYHRGDDSAVYFDTLNVFIALMLLGRYLQERALLKSRRSLLKGDAFEALTVTVLGPPLCEIKMPAVRQGMRLLLQPGAMAPVELKLLEGPAEFDLAAISGEARPILLQEGDSVRAGARLASSLALRAEALSDFKASHLAALLPAEGSDEELPVIWRWSVRYYLFFALAAALGGLLFWLWKDPSKAGNIFVAALVVTCPCGLGLAVPLARTQALRQLLKMGVTLRQGGVLDRLHSVKQVFFDKTGTLTFANLELLDPTVLDRLAPAAQNALMGATASSRHPVSRALFHELQARGVAFPKEGRAQELPGLGMRFSDPFGEWFLGRSMDEQGSILPARASLSLDGVAVASFDFREKLLEDAPAAVCELRSMGLNVGLLSGDHPLRVKWCAAKLGIPAGEAHGALAPAEKAKAVAAEPALMLGDGLNDGLAMAAATVGGTPSWERSLVSERAGFTFSSGSLDWLPRFFRIAGRLRSVLWLNLAFAWSYNLVMVSLTLAGLVTPLVCAVVMPLSALFAITLSRRLMELK